MVNLGLGSILSNASQLQGGLKTLANTYAGVVSGASDLWSSAQTKDDVKDAFIKTTASGIDAARTTKDVVKSEKSTIKNLFKSIKSFCKNVRKSLKTSIKSLRKSSVANAKELYQEAKPGIWSIYKSAKSEYKSIKKDAKGELKSFYKNAKSGIKDIKNGNTEVGVATIVNSADSGIENLAGDVGFGLYTVYGSMQANYGTLANAAVNYLNNTDASISAFLNSPVPSAIIDTAVQLANS